MDRGAAAGGSPLRERLSPSPGDMPSLPSKPRKGDFRAPASLGHLVQCALLEEESEDEA